MVAFFSPETVPHLLILLISSCLDYIFACMDLKYGDADTC